MARAAVIVASGSSRRMGFDKLAARLAGKAVLRHTVEAFLAVPGLSRVVVVAPEERFSSLLGDLADPRLARVDGGSERQDSVQAGLAALPPGTEWVAVHDGARPLVRASAIDATFEAAAAHGAAVLARPVVETLKRSSADGFAAEPVPRDDLWIMETPQTFRVSDLLRAYAHVAAAGLHVTDEVSALESIGLRTRLVASPFPNPKITHAADLAVAAALISLDEGELPDPS